MNIRVTLSLLLTALLVCTSCMDEDRSTCSPGLELQLSYTLNRHNVDRFGEEVEAVTALVFDQNDLYLDTYSCKYSQLLANNVMFIPLTVGDYSVVVYGGTMKGYVVGEFSSENNVFTPELIKGKTLRSDVMVKVEGDPTIQPQPKKEISALFHGLVNKITVQQQALPTRVDVSLIKNTNKLRFNIKGLGNFALPGQPQGIDVDLWCEGKNGRYKFDNSLGPQAPTLIYYSNNKTNQEDYASADFYTLRLLDDASMTFTMRDAKTQQVISTMNVVETILQIPGFQTVSDMDKCDEYNFDLNFNIDLSITIVINGWEIVRLEPIV